ncbi:hypothetical protein LTR62_005738 [Meristemomyces frigidus]|uniref:XPG-I domain-containing protein n=1 Tax=Meristemomyces frigidus TaxID=1508187 RepID=A0AAN7TGM2_9PEZI|nr:hypothetical protein LTR62_005738 [Meristemomyces frigidus]
MGIHGLFRELGPAPRISLAKLASDHFTTTGQPLRLAIDIQIWLFQIQCGKGGSNPALRTFYYRLLRLLTLNIWPLFVFDGPNKPLFKRNKKVGGQGVKVATVPEFLAKQLLKEFGFPWHVAPGEAEAECALLQRERMVDAVMSEDVDTLMFGSGITLRNWTSENSTKSPTHVSVYREEETRERSRGVDRQGMILVALMSGGDYLPEGIPGCGPKVACDAARAGFGSELCRLRRSDAAGLREWKERLQYEIRTNESKHFSRKNGSFTMPEDFPNAEVLGYYTHPCVSTAEKVQRLKDSVKWDLPMDYAALRSFASDAFDWRNLGGAKKFIKNLAPALLVRELRRIGGENEKQTLDEEAQEEAEKALVKAIHGKRTHNTTDGELEFRISFVPASLVPIDLSLEDEDDDFMPAGGGLDSDVESESAGPPPSTAASVVDDDDEGGPTSPTKKRRQMKPFDPDQPEKLWILRSLLQVGCPLLVEEYEASLRDPKEFLKQRHQAKAVTAENNTHAAPAKKTGGKKNKVALSSNMPANALMVYAKVSKAGKEVPSKAGSKDRVVFGDNPSQGTSQRSLESENEDDYSVLKPASSFLVQPKPKPTKTANNRQQKTPPPSSAPQPGQASRFEDIHIIDLSTTPRPFARFTVSAKLPTQTASPAAALKRIARQQQAKEQLLSTRQQSPPRRKRQSAELSSPTPPSPARSQKSITHWYSPSPRKARAGPFPDYEIVDLVSSPPPALHSPDGLMRAARAQTPTPPNLRAKFVRSPSPSWAPGEGRMGLLDDVVTADCTADTFFSPGRLPDTVTKRRPRGPVRRSNTAPVGGEVLVDDELTPRALRGGESVVRLLGDGVGVQRQNVEDIGLEMLSPVRDHEDDGGGFLHYDGCNDGSGRAGSAIDDDHDHDHDLHSPLSFLTERPISFTKPCAPVLAPLEKVAAHITQSIPSTIQQTNPFLSATSALSALPPAQTHLNRPKKKAFLLRESLEGAWKEVDAEVLDLTGDPNKPATKGAGGRIAGKAWRASGVEVLDLTGV